MSKADTLLISCGALNTLRLLDPLEKRCKVPWFRAHLTLCGPASGCWD